MSGNIEPTGAPPGVPGNLVTPQGSVPAIGVPNTQDYPRLVFSAPYFETVAIAEIIQPSVTEAVENVLPSLVPPYVDAAALAAVQQNAVLLTGSTMSGSLNLSPLMPTADSMAATKAYVDTMLSTAGIPEVPPVPSGQVWARETGQWVPISQTEGTFLPLAGGSMTGNINMSGNTVTNMAAVPAMPNGAAPAQWVLNQIASVSLYQGTWDVDTNVPDLTQLSVRVNGYTWIAITTSVSGVVVTQPIPGLQGLTIYNGDTIIYSTAQGTFSSIHAGGLTLPEADARYVQLGGSQMSGALLLNANASQPLQAVTLQQLQAFVPPGAVGEAPNDGQLYGRNGLTASWSPVLPLAGGILTGALTLAGNAVASLNAVPLQQLTSSLGAYVPLAGNVTMTGPLTMGTAGVLTLNGNAAANLQAVPLQQLTATLAGYATLPQLQAANRTNYVDNSGFVLNQHAYTSGTALAAGAYSFDRWKAGAAGATVNFTASPASTQVTISAGSLQQVIEGAELISGAYMLSWSGTAQGRIATTSGGGTYAASPISFPATGNVNTFIEFNAGTLSQVKLQLGSMVTAWEPEPSTLLVARCQRFYQIGNFGLQGFSPSNAITVGYEQTLAVVMRAIPTMTMLTESSNAGMAARTLAPDSVNQFRPNGSSGANGAFSWTGTFSASADL